MLMLKCAKDLRCMNCFEKMRVGRSGERCYGCLKRICVGLIEVESSRHVPSFNIRASCTNR